MITFFPGPSRVFPQVRAWMQQAFDEGILSISHRSEGFNKLSATTLSNLRTRLHIPEGFSIFYTTSATESWEIISQSLVRNASRHIYSGAFGEKWFQYAQNIHKASSGNQFSVNEVLDPAKVQIFTHDEIICLTHNETSNGTQVKPEIIKAFKDYFPDKLIAVDVTSSINGVAIPFEVADVWFGSVQKCFGLPAGLGLLICSPRAIERALEINDQRYYNSLPLMYQHIQKYQTSHTPNVLGIYLLNKVLENSQSLAETDALIKERAKAYYELVEAVPSLSLLVENKDVRSETVVTVKAQPEQIVKFKEMAKAEGILLGAGYGKWKESTFRIANFPAIQATEVEKLMSFLKTL